MRGPAAGGRPMTRAAREAAAPLAAAALAAAALLALGRTPWAPLLHHPPGAEGGGHMAHSAPALGAAAWLVGWSLMVVAMMLPGAVPFVGHVGRGVRARGGGRLEPALALAGFLGAWGTFGLAVLAAVALPWTAPPGAVLVAVGLHQLSPLKARALAHCRAHRRLLPAGWATGRDPTGDAVRAGIAHGAASVGCCGPLMAATALLAMDRPLLMLLAGLAMTAEAAAPSGARVRVPLGAALLAAGAMATALL